LPCRLCGTKCQGGKLGGAISGKITGPRTIRNALEWRKEHPQEFLNILRQFQKAGSKWRRDHPEETSETGRKGARALHELIASGKVKRNFVFRGKFVWHDEGPRRHFHRSLSEMKRCKELYESTCPAFLHPNLYFRGIELDRVVSSDLEGFDKDDPKTWDQVIEYHPVVRTWKGETSKQDYQDERIEQIRQPGITCGVRFI
jgi:hypothetical protein